MSYYYNSLNGRSNMMISNVYFVVVFSLMSFSNLDKWPATTFSTPFYLLFTSRTLVAIVSIGASFV